MTEKEVLARNRVRLRTDEMRRFARRLAAGDAFLLREFERICQEAERACLRIELDLLARLERGGS